MFDVLIHDGMVYDGTGNASYVVDVGIRGDRIVVLGKLDPKDASIVIDAKGRAVAPGFINMLSWSNESLIADGRSQGEIRQGVTLEVLGEGTSMGPLNPAMKKRALAAQNDITYPIEWTTLGEYLAWLEKRGISTNVASFIGAATIRTHVLGLEDVQPTPAQLADPVLGAQRRQRGALQARAGSLRARPHRARDARARTDVPDAARQFPLAEAARADRQDALRRREGARRGRGRRASRPGARGPFARGRGLFQHER